MDVRRGFCWRCMKKLKEPTVCNSCKIAEYCSGSCLEDDDARHGSKECPMWSPKKCNRCNETGTRYECSGCYTTWYCGVSCQKLDWGTHKSTCRQWRDRAIEVARNKLATEADKKQKLDFTSYFGTTLALDLLNLPENEYKSGEREKKERRSEEYNVLLAACGDLRHVIQTVRELPSTFRGKLSFLLNDVDPFAIARNVLFLFMMVAVKGEDQSSRIATLYFSFRLTEEDHNFLQMCLGRLNEIDAADQLRNVTKGFIDMSEDDLSWVKDVWKCWKEMNCRIGSECATRIINERQCSFAQDLSFTQGFPFYFENVPEFQISIEQWMTDGIVTSSYQRQMKFPYVNPTLVGRVRAEMEDVKKNRPSLWQVHYCIRSDCFPWRSWDYFDMVKVINHDSITVLCHAFLADSVKKMIQNFEEERLNMQLKIGDFHDLKSVSEFHHRFDRILSSNMADIYGHTRVVEQLEPLLSFKNSNAILITQVYNWKHPMGDELPYSRNNLSEAVRLNRLARRDLPGCKSSVEVSLKGRFILDDYANDIPFFVNFLRGEHLAFASKFDQKELITNKNTIKLPKLEEVQHCHGLVMRNFRCERNHVVPFKFRINARPVTMIRVGMINLEWYRPTP